MRLRNRIVVAAGLLCLFLLTGCGEKQKFVHYSLDYFDTGSVITGYEKSQEDFDENVKKIEEQLIKCHKLFDIYFNYDDIVNVRTINSTTNGMHTIQKVDPVLMDMLSFCRYIYDLTEGKTNVAMGSVLSIWHLARSIGEDDYTQAYLPDIDRLKAAAEHTSFDTVEIDTENNTVFISDPVQTLDVGAVAKGWAIEYTARWMEENGITGYCLNIGGNVRPVGYKGDNETLWGVGVENPLYDKEKDTPDKANILVLDFTDKAIAISGSYQRYYYVDGIKYHHIIDPDTLMPENRWISVSVISDHAGLSDGLSTALFNMSLEEGKRLLEKPELAGVEVAWYTTEGELYYTEGMEKYIRK